MTWCAQAEFSIKFDWGSEGLRALKPFSDVIVIVDILSFTTCVTVACEVGGIVFPFPWKDDRAAAFASKINAILAGGRGGGARISLSPPSLLNLSIGEKVVLPSPNGSQLSTETAGTPTIAASLRNATAAARAALSMGRRVAVIAAGERWQGSDTLRPCVEDFLGAGAVISALAGQKSSEAAAAEAAFRAAAPVILQTIQASASGRELIQKGYPGDVEMASQWDSTEVVGHLRNGSYECLSTN